MVFQRLAPSAHREAIAQAIDSTMNLTPPIPLGLHWFTGMYLFALPYAAKLKIRRGDWRSARGAE